MWGPFFPPIKLLLLFFFFFNKKPSPLRGECRHQIGVLGEFKRGVDVAHEDWLGVREGTHLLGEHPLHPKFLTHIHERTRKKIL
ncbi:hypothetical protein Hanom_Chr09g00818581 [Helianthus anomalus]